MARGCVRHNSGIWGERKIGARTSAARSSKSGVEAKAGGKPSFDSVTEEVEEHLSENMGIKEPEIMTTREEQQRGQESTPSYGSVLHNSMRLKKQKVGKK